MFAPLHMKSEYSLEEGVAPVEDLLRRAADSGYPAAALTDVENLHGQVRFHLAARSLGVRPITGVELRAAPHGGPGGAASRRWKRSRRRARSCPIPAACGDGSSMRLELWRRPWRWPSNAASTCWR